MKSAPALFALTFLLLVANPGPGRTGWASAQAESAPADSVQAGSRPRIKNRELLKSDMRFLAREEVPNLRKWQRRKSARVAVLCNMVLPGLGEVYNGRRFKAAAVAGISYFFISTIWVEHKRSIARKKLRDQYPAFSLAWREQDVLYQFHKANSIDFAWWSGAIWLLGLIDAFVDAQLYDLRAYNPAVIQTSSNNHYLGFSIGF